MWQDPVREFDRRPDIALVGCGAIAREIYLPGFVAMREKIGNIWLIDRSDLNRHSASQLCSAETSTAMSDISAEPGTCDHSDT